MAAEFLSELHRAAIEYARDGYPVFPCVVGGKTPAVVGGFKSATTDENQINEWWKENPDYNIGTEPERSGLCVVDVEGTDLANWEKLIVQNGGVKTFTTRTPRGGLHLWYEGSLPPTVKGAFNGYNIDTRGRGSYVLLPPSIVGGKEYETIDDTPPAPLLKWITKRVDARKHEKQLAPEGIQFDVSTNIAAAKDWLSRQTPPVEGERNSKTFPAACQLKDLGCSPQTVFDLLRTWERTLDDEELETIVDSAFKNGQNAPGCDATRPMAEVFEGVQPPRIERSRLHCESEAEQDMTPPNEWQLEGVLPSTGIVLAYGASGAYKSFLFLDMAMGIASGLEAWGLKPQKPGVVIYGALEGRNEIKRKRRPAWRLAKGVTGEVPFYVSRAPLLGAPGEQEEFVEQIKLAAGKRPIRAIFLETAAKMMVGLDATKDVPRLVLYCEKLAECFNCVVVVSHHAGHDAEKGPKDSSTYGQAFDTVIQITTPALHSRISVAKVTKHKDAEEPEQPFTFKGHKIGGSLVFQRTSLLEHKIATKKEDVFARAKIGAALRELKAVGLDHAVSTGVLAGKLVPFLETDTLEEHQAAVDDAARRLGKLAKNLLEAYCTRGKAGLLWHMPE